MSEPPPSVGALSPYASRGHEWDEVLPGFWIRVNPTGKVCGGSKSKTRLDARVLKAGSTIRPWRLHDLRRECAIRMAETGILPHVIEAVLNHVSGHREGGAGIYDRATYQKEKREALYEWADYVLRLPDN